MYRRSDKEKRKSLSCVLVLCKTWNEAFWRFNRTMTAKKCAKKVWCTWFTILTCTYYILCHRKRQSCKTSKTSYQHWWKWMLDQILPGPASMPAHHFSSRSPNDWILRRHSRLLDHNGSIPPACDKSCILQMWYSDMNPYLELNSRVLCPPSIYFPVFWFNGMMLFDENASRAMCQNHGPRGTDS